MTEEKKPVLLVATPEEIAEGKVTDVYFARTREILKARGIRKRVRAEIMVKSLPRGWPWAILAGLEETLELLSGHPVSVRSMAEGTFFTPYLPVMEIEGDYLEFGVYETAVLGFLCQASGITTAAARCAKLADGRPVISFGARRMHPSIAPMIERNAYIGGCSGVATVKSAEVLGIQPTGTIPHALVILMGDSVKATAAFHEIVDPAVPRVALVDTFGDEKFEAMAVADALGDSLYGVRVDTTSSRRGDFLRILKEVRWELDIRGHSKVRIFASGGITESEILRLKEVVDAYGIGTAISGAPTVDFSLDIVEVDGQPMAKRGKMSGGKELFRCDGCGMDLLRPLGAKPPACTGCGGATRSLLETVMTDGVRTAPPENPESARRRVLSQLESLEVEPA